MLVKGGTADNVVLTDCIEDCQKGKMKRKTKYKKLLTHIKYTVKHAHSRFHYSCAGKVREYMMTSSNGNIFCVTGHLCGEFTGPRWIPHTKTSDAELWCFSLICVWINGWVNTRGAGDLRRYRAHYDVIVMTNSQPQYIHLGGCWYPRICLRITHSHHHVSIVLF